MHHCILAPVINSSLYLLLQYCGGGVEEDIKLALLVVKTPKVADYRIIFQLYKVHKTLIDLGFLLRSRRRGITCRNSVQSPEFRFGCFTVHGVGSVDEFSLELSGEVSWCLLLTMPLGFPRAVLIHVFIAGISHA